jgi:hypothetical protein
MEMPGRIRGVDSHVSTGPSMISLLSSSLNWYHTRLMFSFMLEIGPVRPLGTCRSRRQVNVHPIQMASRWLHTSMRVPSGGADGCASVLSAEVEFEVWMRRFLAAGAALLPFGLWVWQREPGRLSIDDLYTGIGEEVVLALLSHSKRVTYRRAEALPVLGLICAVLSCD